MDAVKCYYEIDEVAYQGCLVCNALLNCSPQGKFVFAAGSPLPKASLFSLSLLSTYLLSRFSSTVQNTFPGMESSVMPPQLLQSQIFPFLAVSR